MTALIRTLDKYTEKCTLCPRKCSINRKRGEKGYCQAGYLPIVYTYFLHKGEEPLISAGRGSGTIFFSGCSLRCIYCQNYKFSHFIKGERVTEEKLAEIMLELQEKGASNINLVTPTHFLSPIAKAIILARRQGLNIPIVYNTSGYERVEIIKLINPLIDVYLSDFRYISSPLAQCYSQAPNYPQIAKKAILEMVRAKKIKVNSSKTKKVLEQGVIIRILVLPNYVNEAIEILRWLNEKKVLEKVYLSLMSQYQPYFLAKKDPRLKRPLMPEEYQKVVSFAYSLGITKGWTQEEPQERLAGIYFKPHY